MAGDPIAERFEELESAIAELETENKALAAKIKTLEETIAKLTEQLAGFAPKEHSHPELGERITALENKPRAARVI